jgi:hypothetical protein
MHFLEKSAFHIIFLKAPLARQYKYMKHFLGKSAQKVSQSIF